jgi:hypothetical protein
LIFFSLLLWLEGLGQRWGLRPVKALTGNLADVKLHLSVHLTDVHDCCPRVPADKRVVCPGQTLVELIFNFLKVEERARSQSFGPRLVECLKMLNEVRLCAVFDLVQLS